MGNLWVRPFAVQAVKLFFILSVLYSLLYTSNVFAGGGPPPPPPIAGPTFTPNGGTHDESVTVAISTSHSRSRIYYSINGGVYSVYSSPVTISSNSSLSAYSKKFLGPFGGGWETSLTTSTNFTVIPKLAIPTSSPNGGNFDDYVTVTLSSSDPGAEYRYTLDGTTPTSASSFSSGTITITQSSNLKVYAFKDGYIDSNVLSTNFNITQSSSGGGSGGSGGGGPVSGDLVGSIAGEFSVSNNGAATYSIPIAIPPGTAGVQPKLALNYSSQGRNGLLGLGWFIGGLSVLHRCPANLVKDGFIDGINFDDNDRFCLDGQPLIAINGIYGADGTEYRTEINNFSKIISYDTNGDGPDYFKVWTKSGEIMEYGTTPDSYINPPLANGSLQQIALCWLLAKVTDTVGNYLTIAYFENESTGENYPLRIDYTGNTSAGLSPYNSVEFLYEDRVDIGFKFINGTQIESTKRLINLTSKNNGNKVVDYQISYTESVSTGRSQIETITQCDLNNECIPYTSFNWEDEGSPMFESNAGLALPFPLVEASSSGNSFFDMNTQLVDLNGDGLLDLAYAIDKLQYISEGAYLNTGVGWTFAPEYTPPYLLAVTETCFSACAYTTNIQEMGSRFVDLNGDGLVDFVYNQFNTYDYTQGPRGAYLNTGSGWVSAPQFNLPSRLVEYDGISWQSVKAEFVDLDADGLQDFTYYYQSISNGQILRGAYLNTGSGWEYSSDHLPPFYLSQFYLGYGYTKTSAQYIDLNGDTLPDVVSAYLSGSSLVSNTYLNTGTGWDLAADYNLPKYLAEYKNSRYSPSGAEFADLNGDGLPDFLFSVYNGSTYDKGAWLNTGKGWELDNRFDPPTFLGRSYLPPSSSTTILSKSGVKFVDLNADGLQDCVYSNYSGGTDKDAWINTGSGWESNPDLAPPHYLARWDISGYRDSGARYADLNGDGMLEFMYSITWTWNLTSISKGTYINTGKIEYVDNITNGLGIGIDIAKSSILNSNVYQKNGCIGDHCYPTIDLNAPLQVVSETRTDNGIGNKSILVYQYEDAKVHMQGRGLLGFAKRKVIDITSNIEVDLNFNQEFPYIGLVNSKETTVNGIVTSHEENIFDSQGNAISGPAFPFISESNKYSCDLVSGSPSSCDSGDAWLLTTVTTNSTYDNFGNPTDITVTTDDVGIDTYTTTTVNTYTNDTTKWHLGRLTQAVVTKTGGAQSSPARTSTFEYDSASGLLTKETIEPNSSFELIKTYTHDSFGNRDSVTESGTGITSRTTTTNYDSKGQFPVTITNDLGHIETRGNYDAYGNPGFLTGPNDLTTTWEYDTLGRKSKETRADGTVTDITYEFCGSCPSQVSTLASYKITTTTTGSATSTQYYDAVNRVILTETESFDGTSVFAETKFDAQGRVDERSNPYFGTTTTYWTEYEYDELGRVTQEISPTTGTTSMAYSGFMTTVTNDENQTSKEQTNSLGQTLWTEDDNDNQLTFEYDAQGNLISVTDSEDNVTSNTYNLRGFKTQMLDPDMGTWTYSYNALGELTSQTDAKSQTVSMTYDTLGRLITRIENEGTTTWTYDNCTKGKGKPCSVSHYGGYSRTHTYDDKGRPSSTTTTISGTSYTTTTTYDGSGRVEDVTYPSSTNFKVEHVYNTWGYLQKVRNANNASEEYYFAQAADHFGNITTETLGHGAGAITTFRSYQQNSGRIHHIDSVVQDLEYTFDNLGNLTQRKDHDQTGLTEDFSYDNLNRLTQTNVVGAGTVTFTYDDLGNITNKSDVGNYSYGAGNAGPHAVTNAGGITYAYDNNGNQISGDGKTITWSSYNKPTLITKGGSSSAFTYGPDRARYLQVTDDGTDITTTTYIGGLYEKVEIGSETKEKHFIRAGSQTIAIYTTSNQTSDTTEYLHRDHLGSIDTITDASGMVVDKLSFDAFGKRRLSNWNAGVPVLNSLHNTRGFTGHEMLDAVGLIHMNGRVYDPLLGRFMSADPTMQFPKNMQNYNRYSYVLNNPLSYTDSSGFFLDDLFDSIGGIFDDIVDTIVDVIVHDFIQQILQIAAFAVGTYACGGNTQCGEIAATFTKAALLTATTAGEFVGGLEGSVRTPGINPIGLSGNSQVPVHWSVGEAPATTASASSTTASSGLDTAAEIIIALSNADTGEGKSGNGADTQAFRYILGNDSTYDTFSERAQIYRNLRDRLIILGIDTVWFDTAAALNDLFSRKRALLSLGFVRDDLNRLGVELLVKNIKTFNEIISGEIEERGVALDELLVNREQGYVEEYLKRIESTVNPYERIAFNIPFQDERFSGSEIRNAVREVELRTGREFDFFNLDDRVSLGNILTRNRRN